jgi:release factor glutamine methyltransferase
MTFIKNLLKDFSLTNSEITLNYPRKGKRPGKLLVKKIEPLFQVLYKFYCKRTHRYNYFGIQVSVPPGIFNPQISFSTKYLLSFLSKEDLKGHSFLEVGSGSGVVSLFAAKIGAQVTAVDINPLAINCTRENVESNGLNVDVILSDVFEAIPDSTFDFIVVNPPYYPEAPKNDIEKAWFCGENFDFFHRFFSQLKSYLKIDSRTFMVLSEDCEIEEIKHIANMSGFSMEVESERLIYWEINYIFLIQHINAN